MFLLRPMTGWNGNGTVVLTIDGRAIPVVSDGVGDVGLAVHEARAFDGMSRDFLDRLTTGRSLTLGGTAATGPVAQRSFPLNGAAGALRSVAATCPGLA